MHKTNKNFWSKKINRNKERDKNDQQTLAAMGWHCITIWECQLRPAFRNETLTSLEYTLNHIYLRDHTQGYPPLEEEETYGKVAEQDPNDE